MNTTNRMHIFKVSVLALCAVGTKGLPVKIDRPSNTSSTAPSVYTEYPNFTDTPTIKLPGINETYPDFKDTPTIVLPAPEESADVPNFVDTPTIVLPEPANTSSPNATPKPHTYSYPALNLTDIDLSDENNITFEANGLIDSNAKSFWKSVEKLTKKDEIYKSMAKDTGITPAEAMEKFNKAVKIIERKEKTVKCKLAPNDFEGLCLNSKNQVVYRNNNRASKHLYRSVFMPIHGYMTMKVTHLVQYYVCNWSIFDPIRDYFHCNLWKYEKQLTEVIFGGLLSYGYQEFTGKPFYARAAKLINGYAKVGYTFAGYNAVSHTGEVVPLKDIPKDFDLSYVFSNYGDPDGRNASLAIFPGNKDSELGFSFISKPWDPAPKTIAESGSWFEMEKYHWHYVMKIDTEEINYQLDKISPEELFHQVKTKVIDLKDYLYYGGGLLANKHNIFLKVDDLGDDETDLSDDVFKSVFNSDSEEVFSVNFHGIIIRVSLEEDSKHTVNWDRMTI